MDFEFDAAAVAAGYASDAEQYAAQHGDTIESTDFDRIVVARLLADVPPGGLVLDAGCGPGPAALFSERRGFAAVGLDLTREMLEVARERVDAPVVQGDLRALPFATRCFDAVIAWYSLLHLPRSAMPGALDDIRRVMRLGAPLIVALHSKRFGESGVEWSASTANELGRLLVDAGFNDVIARTRTPQPHEYQVVKVVASGVR
jgi:ubiquinone/menaquinone biosynthesis C-methylase UbiE